MRTIIVGDIHGCHNEFAALLNKVELDVDGDKLILLGDTMDRGTTGSVFMQEFHQRDWMRRNGEVSVLIRDAFMGESCLP